MKALETHNTLIKPECKVVPCSATTKQKLKSLYGKKATVSKNKARKEWKDLLKGFSSGGDANFIWNDN